MPKRLMYRKLLILSLVLFLLATVALLVGRRNYSKINRENFDRISDGMTVTEVEELLGGPERDETNGDFPTVAVVHQTGMDADIIYSESSKQWNSSEGWICVDFDKQERVCQKKFVDGRWLRPTWIDYVRGLLGGESGP